MNRRDFLKITGVAASGLVCAGSTYLVLNDESETIVVDRLTLPIRNLGSRFEGFTIAQLSDIHLLPYTTPEFIAQAVTMINALQPDLVCLTGDFVWHELEAIFELSPVLADLNARFGVWASLGNHDLWTNVKVVIQGLQEAGIPTLVNAGFPITIGDQVLYLAGLDDAWSGKPDLEAALAFAPPGAPVVLMAHEPDPADDYSQDPRLALQLAGHSHGGQIRLPVVGALVLPHLGRKYDFGLYKIKDMWLYTNRGIGSTNEPIRFNCPPEITYITLVGG